MPTGWKLIVSKCFLIPQRYVLGIMGFFAIVNAYTMRVALNLAITEMVPVVNITQHEDPEACTNEMVDWKPKGSTKTEYVYDWDSQTQGIILGSFYWGYIVTHIPGGMLAEMFGGKYTLGLGILSTAILTLITPPVIYATHGSWEALVALRVLEGLGEGFTYPSISALLAQWVPVHERGKIGSLVYAGSQIGTVASSLGGGYLIHKTEYWSSVFYLFGVIAVIWFIIFVLICYSKPDDHPFISDKERSYLKEQIENTASTSLPVPWRAIATSVPVWALIFAQIGHDWGFFTMVTDLPTYFRDVLRFNIKQNGVWSSLPYIIMWLSSLGFGYLCDFLVIRGYMSITFSRKFFTAAAKIGPAIFIIAASYSGCDRTAAVAFFTIGMGIMGTYYCGMKVNALDLCPNFAGTLMGIVNGIGAITGILAPFAAGALTGKHTVGEWRTVFWISFGVFVVTSVIYILFGSADEQWWNMPKEDAANEENPTTPIPTPKRKWNPFAKKNDDN